jgi:predicted MFS family arabinose efflux permease
MRFFDRDLRRVSSPQTTDLGERELARHWKTVLAAMVGVGFGCTGLPFYTLGLFVRPLGGTFHWTRAEVTGSSFFLHGGVIVIAPFVGTLVDKFGPRRVGLVSLAGLAAGLLTLSLANRHVSSLYLGWTLLAVLGSGTTPIVWTRAVNRCFNRQRGIALGLSMAGTGLAAIFGPMLLTPILQEYGWRAAYRVMAVATAFVALPLVALLLDETREGNDVQAPVDGTPLKAALRTGWFWRAIVCFMVLGGGIAALIVHMTPLLIDSGRTVAQAGRVASLLGIAVIVGRLSVGVLLDRFPATLVGMGFLLLPVVGCLLLRDGIAVPAVLLIGLAAGAEVDFLAYLVSRRFGLSHYGRIYAWQLAAFLFGAALSPTLMGAAHDASGSYQTALGVDAGLILVGALMIATLHVERVRP